MDKSNLIKTLREQAINFDENVQHKLSTLMSPDYTFIDVATYLSMVNTPIKSDIDLLQDAFQTNNMAKPHHIPDIVPSQREKAAQRLENIRQEQTMDQPTTNSLQDKIAALRGCSLPGSYLIKQ